MAHSNRKALIALAVSALMAATGAQAQVSDDVVRIGVMADQTGPYSGNGGPGSTLAVRMAVEDFGGKVLGKNIEVIVADDQNKPDVGTNIARQWVEQREGRRHCGRFGFVDCVERQRPDEAAQQALSGGRHRHLRPHHQGLLADELPVPGGHLLAAQARRAPLGTTDFSSYLLQAQASKAQAIVIVNAGADQTNALRQAVEYRITRGGQAIAVFGMTINAVQAMGLEVAQGLQFTDPMYWDHTPETRAWAKRFMDRNNGVAPTYIMASAYTAASHYLKAVQAAGTDEGTAVMARMKATPINDFSMKNVRIREDGQTMRPVYAVQVKQPSESKGRYDYYQVKGELAGDQVFRPLADGGCDFIAAKK